MMNNIPMDKEILRKWLKSGYIETQKLFPTEKGSPQGSPISPVISNMVLDGLEVILKERFSEKKVNGKYHFPKVNFIRYADDFIVTGESRELLEYEVKPLIKEFLRIRGLELSEEKTLITHINDGFDFLGVNVRMYDGKLLTKPSKNNFEAITKKIRKIIKDNPSMKQELLIRKLNPIIRGWVNFQKFNVSAEAFEKLDYEIWQCLWSWCKRRHPKKGRRWVAKKYFHTIGTRTWTFSVPTKDKMENGEDFYVRLIYATNTDIKRFTKIKAAANAFDQEWVEYFVEREEKLMRNEIKGRRIISRLWNDQKGNCAHCYEKITLDTDFRIYEFGFDKKVKQLVHPNCYTKLKAQNENELAL